MNKLLFGAVFLFALQSDDAPFDPHTAKKVRNALGMDDGWTAGEIRREDADRAAYENRLAEWKAQNGGAK